MPLDEAFEYLKKAVNCGYLKFHSGLWAFFEGLYHKGKLASKNGLDLIDEASSYCEQQSGDINAASTTSSSLLGPGPKPLQLPQQHPPLQQPLTQQQRLQQPPLQLPVLPDRASDDAATSRILQATLEKVSSLLGRAPTPSLPTSSVRGSISSHNPFAAPPRPAPGIALPSSVVQAAVDAFSETEPSPEAPREPDVLASIREQIERLQSSQREISMLIVRRLEETAWTPVLARGKRKKHRAEDELLTSLRVEQEDNAAQMAFLKSELARLKARAASPMPTAATLTSKQSMEMRKQSALPQPHAPIQSRQRDAPRKRSTAPKLSPADWPALPPSQQTTGLSQPSKSRPQNPPLAPPTRPAPPTNAAAIEKDLLSQAQSSHESLKRSGTLSTTLGAFRFMGWVIRDLSRAPESNLAKIALREFNKLGFFASNAKFKPPNARLMATLVRFCTLSDADISTIKAIRGSSSALDAYFRLMRALRPLEPSLHSLPTSTEGKRINLESIFPSTAPSASGPIPTTTTSVNAVPSASDVEPTAHTTSTTAENVNCSPPPTAVSATAEHSVALPNEAASSSPGPLSSSPALPTTPTAAEGAQCTSTVTAAAITLPVPDDAQPVEVTDTPATDLTDSTRSTEVVDTISPPPPTASLANVQDAPSVALSGEAAPAPSSQPIILSEVPKDAVTPITADGTPCSSTTTSASSVPSAVEISAVPTPSVRVIAQPDEALVTSTSTTTRSSIVPALSLPSNIQWANNLCALMAFISAAAVAVSKFSPSSRAIFDNALASLKKESGNFSITYALWETVALAADAALHPDGLRDRIQNAIAKARQLCREGVPSSGSAAYYRYGFSAGTLPHLGNSIAVYNIFDLFFPFHGLECNANGIPPCVMAEAIPYVNAVAHLHSLFLVTETTSVKCASCNELRVLTTKYCVGSSGVFESSSKTVIELAPTSEDVVAATVTPIKTFGPIPTAPCSGCGIPGLIQRSRSIIGALALIIPQPNCIFVPIDGNIHGQAADTTAVVVHAPDHFISIVKGPNGSAIIYDSLAAQRHPNGEQTNNNFYLHLNNLPQQGMSITHVILNLEPGNGGPECKSTAVFVDTVDLTLETSSSDESDTDSDVVSVSISPASVRVSPSSSRKTIATTTTISPLAPATLPGSDAARRPVAAPESSPKLTRSSSLPVSSPLPRRFSARLAAQAISNVSQPEVVSRPPLPSRRQSFDAKHIRASAGVGPYRRRSLSTPSVESI